MRLRKTVGIVNSNADAREIKRSRFQPNTKQTSVPREDISIVIGLFIQFQDMVSIEYCKSLKLFSKYLVSNFKQFKAEYI